MSLRRIDFVVAAAALLIVLALIVLLSSSAAHAATTLEQGIKRETALLVAEKNALQRERERIDVEHDARAAALRAEIATLEARLVEASGREATLRAGLDAAVRAEQPSPSLASTATTTEAIRATFAALASAVPLVEAGNEPIVALLPAAARRIEERTRPETLESGFFDADGAWQQGRVTTWGGLAWAAAATSAGPLQPAIDGARQLAAAPSAASDLARAFVNGDAPPQIPLALRAAAEHETDESLVPVSFVERFGRLGTDGVLLVLALMGALAIALYPLARVFRQQRAVDAVASRLPSLVRAEEFAAAAALARTVPGAAGRFLHAVVAAASRPTADDEVSTLAVEFGAALERSIHVARAAAIVSGAIVVLVATRAASAATDHVLGMASVDVRAVVDAVAGALLPLQLGAIAAVPWAVVLVIVSAVVARTREQTEVLALRMVDSHRAG